MKFMQSLVLLLALAVSTQGIAKNVAFCNNFAEMFWIYKNSYIKK